MKKVSIIVPFYNVEEYIERSIKSLVEQSLEDIEIILVNDGSKDGSEEIAKEYKRKYPDKIVYLEKENGGLSDARNYALPYATGEYIAFLDSDDYVEEEMYEEMYVTAKMDKADIVECDYLWEYPEETIESKGRAYKDRKDMLLNARVVAWNKLIKKEIARNIKVANSPLNYEQTSDFGAQIFANDFSQDYSDIENFCKENGGLTEQEAIFFDSWHASHEEYIALADMLLSTGQDNTKLLSALKALNCLK